MGESIPLLTDLEITKRLQLSALPAYASKLQTAAASWDFTRLPLIQSLLNARSLLDGIMQDIY